MIKRLGPNDLDALNAVAACFDEPIIPEAAARFLSLENHHILVAHEGNQGVGFVTGVETTHPDKGTEMFLYELGVDERFRRKGYGAQLVRGLAALARERGCYGMWVGTEEENEAAVATYKSAGARPQSSFESLGWEF